VCCCQAWALMGLAHGQEAVAPAAAPSCCGSSEFAPADNGPSQPCDDHDNCPGCLPRLGWVPEGPADLDVDLVGSALPVAEFDQLALPVELWRGAARRGMLEPPEHPRRFTLLGLRCALIV
jgi:hypothetical protein